MFREANLINPNRRRSGWELVAVRILCTATVLLIAATAQAFDTAAFVRGCAKSCEPQWRQGSKDPSSPAFGMTEAQINGLCLCTCDKTASDMSPELHEALAKVTKSGGRPTGELAEQMRDLAMKAMVVCVPKFQNPKKK
jgi:hypothetical protein